MIAVAMVGGALEPGVARGESDPFARLQNLPSTVSGARARLKGLPLQRVSPRDVAQMVLAGSPGIAAAGDAVGVAEAQIVVADAAFDPTLFAGLSYTNAFTKARRELIQRDRDRELNESDIPTDAQRQEFQDENARRQATRNDDNPINDEDDLTVREFLCFPDVTVDGQSFDTSGAAPGVCFSNPTEFNAEVEKASFESRSTHTVVGSLGVGIVFPWGGIASTSFASTWRKPPTHSTSGNPSLTNAAFPSGLTYDPYGWNDRPWWTSRFSVTGSMPLPFTKGFGREGSSQYFTFQVARSSERQNRWVERSTENASLNRALQAYWDLVRSVDDLQTFSELRSTLNRRLGSQRRQLEAGLVTEYAIEQLQLQIANLDAQEELAWNFLLVNSNRVLSEIGMRERTLLVPTVNREAMTRTYQVEPAEAFRVALENNPDIKAQEEVHDLSKTTVAFRENQDLPDISLSASFTVGQDSTAFGYDGPWASWRNIVRPDSSEFFIGIQYRLPLGMNITEAQLSRARLEEQQAFDQARQIKQQVVNAVDTALGDLRATEAVASQSVEDIRLANLGFDVSTVQRDEGLISEFEVLNRYQEILLARRNRTAALVAYQKAYIQLLAAQGILARVYGGGA